AGGGPGGGRGAMSDADRQKMREAMQNASPEERQRLMQQFGGGRGPSDQGGGQGRGTGAGQPGSDSQGAGGRSGRDTIQALMAHSSNPFSDEDRANAKLPLPPEKDSQVQVLLRPGLLAD